MNLLAATHSSAFVGALLAGIGLSVLYRDWRAGLGAVLWIGLALLLWAWLWSTTARLAAQDPAVIAFLQSTGLPPLAVTAAMATSSCLVAAPVMELTRQTATGRRRHATPFRVRAGIALFWAGGALAPHIGQAGVWPRESVFLLLAVTALSLALARMIRV